MSKLNLSKDEKLILENSILKENNLSLQLKNIKTERLEFIKSFCDRHSKKIQDLIKLDLQNGTIEFNDEIKKKKSKKIGG